MSIAVIAWQIFIFFTLFISGRKRGWVAAFWVIWTLVQVYALPLSVIQFFTIFVGFSMAKPSVSSLDAPAPVPPPTTQVKFAAAPPRGMSNDTKGLLTVFVGIAAIFGVAYYWERVLDGPSNIPPLVIFGIAIFTIVRYFKYR